MNGSRPVIALVTACLSALGVAAQPVATAFEPAPSTNRGAQILPRGLEVELALSAGPEHLRAEATVYVFGERGDERIKVGNDGFTCLVNRDGMQASDRTLRPTCWDAEGGGTIVPEMLRVGELLAQRKSADEVRRQYCPFRHGVKIT